MSKKNVLFVALVILAGGIIVGFWRYNKFYSASTYPPSQERILANIDRHLTFVQQKIYTDRIQKAEDYIKTLNPAKSNYKQELSNTYVYLGQQHHGLGQMQKAREDYYLALKAVSTDESALVGLSVTLLESSDSPGAAELLKQALAQNPNNPDVWLRYIGVRKSMGATSAELNDLYDQALKVTGRYIDVLTSDADFQEKRGDIAQAIGLWEEAAKSYPQNAAVYRREAARLKAGSAKPQK